MDLCGRFIVFEGLDFSGKSTQVELLAARLRKAGYPVVTTREPGGTPVGEEVRRVILSTKSVKLLPLSELLLFITARAQLCAEVIEPALRERKVVISSRYRLSSVAYQGYGRGIDLELVRQLNEEATGDRYPDLTFLIDLPVSTALARKKGVGDRIEGEDSAFYRRVQDGYIQLARGDSSIHRIDGTLSRGEIAAQVRARLDL